MQLNQAHDQGTPSSRRAPPDYTQRSVKLRLFTYVAAIMLVLAVIERAWDRQFQPWPGTLNRTGGLEEPRDERPTESGLQTAADPRENPPVLHPPTGPANVLEHFEIGPSQFESFVGDQPLSPAENDVLVKILYRFPRLGPEILMRWRQPGVAWNTLAAAPADYRAKVFRLAGRVKRAEKRNLSPEQVELFEFDHYYGVGLSLDDSPYEALIAARRIPAAWSIDAPLDEPAQTDAMFLKVGDGINEAPQLLFVADQIGWYPDRADPNHHIGQAQIALARLGMDFSLWDDVRDGKDESLTAADREAFYQLLAAVNRPDARQLHRVIDKSLDVVSLLQAPAEHSGDVLPVEGIARRVLKVPVSDADIQSRLGLDHYFEIDLFVPLGDASVRLGNDPTGEKNPIYRNAFPATLIVRDLPAGLKEGQYVHEQVRADGVFFKVWNYRSNYTSRFGQLQPAPLFIASRARLAPVQTTTNWVTDALVLAALGTAIGVTAIIVWWHGRSYRAAAATSAPRTKNETKPDFSGLG
jgi:hypothetical protein